MHQYPPNLQAGDIIRLASIPQLQRACFRVSSIADAPSRSQMQHIVAFHSPSALELHVHSLDIATALLELLQTPCLEALTVNVDNLPEPLAFSAFSIALQSTIFFRNFSLPQAQWFRDEFAWCVRCATDTYNAGSRRMRPRSHTITIGHARTENTLSHAVPEGR